MVKRTPLQSLGSGTHYGQKHPPCGSLGLGIRLEGVGQLVMLTMAQKNHIVGKKRLGVYTPGDVSSYVLIIRVWNPSWSKVPL